MWFFWASFLFHVLTAAMILKLLKFSSNNPPAFLLGAIMPAHRILPALTILFALTAHAVDPTKIPYCHNHPGGCQSPVYVVCDFVDPETGLVHAAAISIDLTDFPNRFEKQKVKISHLGNGKVILATVGHAPENNDVGDLMNEKFPLYFLEKDGAGQTIRPSSDEKTEIPAQFHGGEVFRIVRFTDVNVSCRPSY